MTSYISADFIYYHDYYKINRKAALSLSDANTDYKFTKELGLRGSCSH